jgi:hypothetical protein
VRSDNTQLDLYRHSDAGMAAHYRAAAETARQNPWETPDACEQRARFYEQCAAQHEAKAGGTQ